MNKNSNLKTNNINSSESKNLKAADSNAYTNQEINTDDIIDANALNNKADKTNTYLKSEIDSKVTSLPKSSVALGGFLRLSKSVDNTTFSIDRYSLNLVSNTMVCMSLFQLFMV